MKRLARWDVSRRFSHPGARVAAQLAFGIFCAAAMISLRTVLDMIAPTAGPFALVYPTVLLATLYGHWRAGMVAYLTTLLWAWYFVLPLPGAFTFQNPSDPARVAINAGAALVLVIFAEAFRRAVAAGDEENRRELERRTVLLQELEHRTKNNFALVASLLTLQQRRETDPLAADALEIAIGRVHSFARAYANLAESQGEGADVAMPAYLTEIVESVRDALLPEDVEVTVASEIGYLPRETAVAIGLFVNETLTNCAKYAFPDGRPGTVDVALRAAGDGWLLTIADNGAGRAATAAIASSGIGSQLLSAFARQAGAEHEMQLTDTGCTVRLSAAPQ